MRNEMGRRRSLQSAGVLATTPLVGGLASSMTTEPTAPGATPVGASMGRRRLGTLEVSSVGIGVQNMARRYETTVPYRPEMIRILRAAYDRGITFFDTAEAYGPHECEHILGEAIAPFRNEVVITSKFGWNIDFETGVRRPGLNSKPEHVERVVEGMSGDCAPTASTCCTSTAWTRTCRSRTWRAR